VCVLTRRYLRDALVSRQIREDLFYRLDAARVELPALAERLEEVPFLLPHALAGAEPPQRRDEPLHRAARPPQPQQARNAPRTRRVQSTTAAVDRIVRRDHRPRSHNAGTKTVSSVAASPQGTFGHVPTAPATRGHIITSY